MLNIVLWRLHAVVVVLTLLFFLYKLVLLLTGRQEQLRRLRARTRWADSLLLGAGLLTFAAAYLTYTGPKIPWAWVRAVFLTIIALSFVRALRQERRGAARLFLLGLVVSYGLHTYSALVIQGPQQPNVLRQALLGEAPNAVALSGTIPTAAGLPETTATPDADAPVENAPAGLSDADAAAIADATSDEPAATPSPELAAGQALFAKNCVVCHGPDGQRGLNGAHDLTKSNLNTAGRVYLVTNGLGKMPAFQGKLTDAQIQQVVAYSLTLR
ncbi:c-type cytochrome [Hymenobacter yonginensis]|uniref:Cytochrome c n=1 Tax=Hymenobacter yonginensis TaxID=748197 RepID=A0ABY7PLX2_9BACT|nr:cytochrome c [Hymenobacter yonginensis]WBO83701.1 cytochrome c [Hymenobacter yonginensis]